MPFRAPLPALLQAGTWHLRLIADTDWRLEQRMSEDADIPQWTLYPPLLSEEAARRRVESAQRFAATGAGARYVILDAHGEPVGTASVGCSDDGREAEVSYALLAHGRGRGAATCAASTLTEWALAHGPHRVVLMTIIGNSTSEAVARRAGFALEGEESHDQRGVTRRVRRWVRYDEPSARP